MASKTGCIINNGMPQEAPEDVINRISDHLAKKYPLLSPAQALAALPETERNAWIGSLTVDQQAALEFTWPFWARPNQREPKGRYKTLLLLAGRGYGKTRTASEIVRGWVESGEKKHIALVGANAADIRDTMVEAVYKQGSGIMQVCPPWNMPHFSPTKKTIVWNNPNYKSYGAVCSLYSGEEPAGLRGPSHDGAWVDEVCFIAGTQIRTETGEQSIESVDVGTLVWTRDGLHRVVKTSAHVDDDIYTVNFSDGNHITGTGSHPIWNTTKQCFVPIRRMQIGDTLYTCQSLVSSRILSGTENAGGSTEATTAIEEESYCTEKSTRTLMGIFQMAWKYITRTVTSLTMTCPISKHYQKPNTAHSTVLSAKDTPNGDLNGVVPLDRLSGRRGSVTSLERYSAGCAQLFSLLRHITTKCIFVPVNALHRQLGILRNILWKRCVCIVKRYFVSRYTARAEVNNIALSSVHTQLLVQSGKKSLSVEYELPKYGSAESAVVCTSTANPRAQSSAGIVTVVKLQRHSYKRVVYNLEVERCPEYFANGVLVHNCKMKYSDTVMHMLKFTMRRGDNPQIIISTTPKPVPYLIELLKMAQESIDDGTNDIIVVKGSTYENKANLSSEFIKDINQMYEGTTLGRQEIYADLILGADGALWNLEMIDDHRLRPDSDGNMHIPTLQRIIIAVDPQTGYRVDTEKSAASDHGKTMTGIVAVGISMPIRGLPQHAYVLGDYSMNGKPEQWAKEISRVYKMHNASLVVVEQNQGGQMIASVIRSVDPLVRIKLVTAVKKKHERAIPVAAKYEQGRVHHCGVLANLETEMILYEPGDEENKKSPNRMDALTWGVRYLLIDGTRAAVGVAINRVI